LTPQAYNEVLVYGFRSLRRVTIVVNGIARYGWIQDRGDEIEYLGRTTDEVRELAIRAEALA